MSFHTRTLAYRDARGCTTCVQLMMAGGALRGRGKQIVPRKCLAQAAEAEEAKLAQIKEQNMERNS